MELEKRHNEAYHQFEKLKSELQIEKQKVRKFEEKFKTFFNIDNQECWNAAFLNDGKEKYKQALEKIKECIDKQCFKCRNSTLAEYCVKEGCAIWEILQQYEVLND